jgi:hypothetical protein
VRDPRTDRAGERVVGERGDEDAEDDGHRPPELRGEQEREELGFVADFGEGDDAGGDEEGFH